MGRIMLATATFEVNSVAVSAKMHTRNKITTGLKLSSPMRALPSILDSPDDWLPAAMANPPPRTNIKLQCIF